MITDYKEIKESVLGCYEKMIETAHQIGFSTEDTSYISAKNQAEKIKDDRFCLMIAGEAKSGKSTFINAYLGTEILPMDVKQCSSAVVEIAYGKEFYLEATYADDRKKTVTGEAEIHKFLLENAALDDDYRDIPVPTINNEILVKYKDQKIHDGIIRDLLEGVKDENIHRLSTEDYNKKIRDYISLKQPNWKDIVVKINIFYPFEDEELKGIHIIDSPGVNAAGKVGDVTETYIETADAIMFLRPINGQAIEANSFKKFLESKSVDKNKNALFLLLTRTTGSSPQDNNKALEEFKNIFGVGDSENHTGVVEEQIIPVDSKAEMYFNQMKNMSTPEIKEYLARLKDEGRRESFLADAWMESDGEKEEFLNILKRFSNFDLVDQCLNKFGRKASYLLFSDFLERILKLYSKMITSLKNKKENYELKAEDPNKFVVRIHEIEEEIISIENSLHEKTEKISIEYASSDGKIATDANKVIEELKGEIEALDARNNTSIDELEKIAYKKIDFFVEYEKELEKEIVKKCDDVLKIVLSEQNMIQFTSLEPDLTPELIEQIKEDVKKDSNESYTYTTGRCFKETHRGSRFSQEKFYTNFSAKIVENLEKIKNQAVRDLRSFASSTVTTYSKELEKNARQLKEELNKVKEDKKSAEEIARFIEEINNQVCVIEPAMEKVRVLKEGIDNNV